METMTLEIQDIKRIDWVLSNLKKIAKTVHRIDENRCNYELSKAQETRATNLLKAANEWAGHLGMKVYHQADPRGCSLYLVPLDFINGADYNSYGMAIAG